ncbi:hypothetical protein [Arthrobacter sp. JSM 101049]|uniref:hypothetical protein n=1 Tax=Arthrobacter sp. JSM 101049 TaxID=929097 RepID=UPI003561C3E2
MTTPANDRDDADRPEETDAPLSEHVAAENDNDDVTEIDAESIPVQGDEDVADDLAEKAYGDKDDDGNPDIPNAQFPA